MKLLPFALTLLLTFFFFGCNSDKEQLQVETNITTYSEDVVELQASGALAYSWRQVSGTHVILINANSATSSFIAPSVTKQETLMFELEAVTTQVQNKNITLKKQVSVTVHPKATVDMDSTSGEVEPEQEDEQEQTNETNTTTKTNTTQPTTSLKSLKLTLEKNSLNVDENTTLKVVATYSDNTTKDVTNTVEWIYADKLALDIKNNILKTFHKDTNIFLQAKLNTITSNAVALEIYKEISGHRLPPEPNPAINNATLLGVDTNDNGVRDDVERKIYAVYKRPIEQVYMMQDAKIYPQTLEDPVAAAQSKELEQENWNIYTCNGYLNHELNIIIPRNNVDFMENAYFNTKERIRAYIEFNEASSGGVYNIPLPRDDNKENCDFNVTKMLEME
jgi:hypothetical protein